MSYLSIGLLVALIAVFIWIKWDDKHKWETVYEASDHRTREAQQRLGYLRKRGVHCRLKNDLPSIGRMTGMGGMQNSTQASIQLQVHKKETEQASRLLADFNG